MIKANKKLLLLTSFITLLPVFAGLILWSKLPEQIPSHWNLSGEIDGWSSKPVAVFGISGIMLAAQLICFFATTMDPKNKNISRKALSLVLWIVPFLSVIVGAVTYCAALGIPVSPERIIPIAVGLIFVIVGNYMPKFQQNYTMGIKLPWTLNSEENWNRTHRFGGRLWVLMGLFVMVSSALGWGWAVLVSFVPIIFLPIGYSYWLYRKGI